MLSVYEGQSALQVQRSIHIHRVVHAVDLLLGRRGFHLAALDSRRMPGRSRRGAFTHCMALLRLTALAERMLILERLELVVELVGLLSDQLIQTLVIGNVDGCIPAAFFLIGDRGGRGRYCLVIGMMLLGRVLQAARRRVLFAQRLVVGQLMVSKRKLKIVLAHDDLLLLPYLRLLARHAWPGVSRPALAHFRR